MPPPGRKLRKREIVLAIAMGAVAAGGAAIILEESDAPSAPFIVATQPDRLTYDVENFDEIATEGPQDVVVTLGDAFSVRSEGPPQALALLEPVVENGTLMIRPRDRINFGNWGALSGATFYVTLPRLDAVALAGSGNVRVDRIEGDSFEGAIAGRGELSIAEMNVEDADFNIGGSGNIIAAGTAGATRVSIGGRGEVQGSGLRSQTASVSINGSGDVALTVEDEARVSIVGSGDVDISGSATCSVTRMGGGDVRCAGGGGTD